MHAHMQGHTHYHAITHTHSHTHPLTLTLTLTHSLAHTYTHARRTCSRPFSRRGARGLHRCVAALQLAMAAEPLRAAGLSDVELLARPAADTADPTGRGASHWVTVDV